MKKIKNISVVSSLTRSFTLLELLTVVGIIMILASFLFPVLSRARETAMQAYCSNNLKQLGSASVLYRNDHRKFPWTEYFMDDFSLIYPYLRVDKVFFCPGNPQSLEGAVLIYGNTNNNNGNNNNKDKDDGDGYRTDYLYWPGGAFKDIEKNGNTNNGHGNNDNAYGKFDPSNPKFKRMLNERNMIDEPVIYDRCGPAHCDSINIVYLLDTRVEAKWDMCDLWMLNKNRELIWKNIDLSIPFPSLDLK